MLLSCSPPAFNSNQPLPSAPRSQRKQVVPDKCNFQAFLWISFTLHCTMLLSRCSSLNLRSTEDVPDSATEHLSQSNTHAEMICTSTHSVVLKLTGAQWIKWMINYATYKWNEADVQTRACVLWCLHTRGRGRTVEGGRRKSGFEVWHTVWYQINCMAKTGEIRVN